MPITFQVGSAFDAIWIQKVGAALPVSSRRLGTMQDARQIVVAVGADHRHQEYDVTPVAAGTPDSMQYEFGPVDPTIVLRVRATTGTVNDDGGNELLLGTTGQRFGIGWRRRGRARAYTNMVVSQISEPETYAREAVATVTLRPGVDNEVMSGGVLYDTRALDGTLSGAVDATSQLIFAG